MRTLASGRPHPDVRTDDLWFWYSDFGMTSIWLLFERRSFIGEKNRITLNVFYIKMVRHKTSTYPTTRLRSNTRQSRSRAYAHMSLPSILKPKTATSYWLELPTAGISSDAPQFRSSSLICFVEYWHSHATAIAERHKNSHNSLVYFFFSLSFAMSTSSPLDDLLSSLQMDGAASAPPRRDTGGLDLHSLRSGTSSLRSFSVRGAPPVETVTSSPTASVLDLTVSLWKLIRQDHLWYYLTKESGNIPIPFDYFDLPLGRGPTAPQYAPCFTSMVWGQSIYKIDTHICYIQVSLLTIIQVSFECRSKPTK